MARFKKLIIYHDNCPEYDESKEEACPEYTWAGFSMSSMYDMECPLCGDRIMIFEEEDDSQI